MTVLARGTPRPSPGGPSPQTPPGASSPHTDQDHRVRDLRRAVPHVADAGRVGRDEPGAGLLRRLRHRQDRRGPGLAGHGYAFTIGRGNDVQLAAIRLLEPFLAGQDLDEVLADLGGPPVAVPAAGPRQPAALARARPAGSSTWRPARC